MSKGNLYSKGLAVLFTVIAVSGWAIPTVTVESRNVAPDELVTLSVNVTEGETVAGANLRITGQGSGLNAADGLAGGAGSIGSGHSSSFNALSTNNDFRSVVYNPTTSTNFTGPGVLHTISGRVGSSVPTGTAIPFTIDTAASALSDIDGNVVGGVTFQSGSLTVTTQFPFSEPFDGTTGNGWTYFNNAGGIFEFGNIFGDTPDGSLIIQNPEDRSFGFWIGPTTITQSFRGNLVIHNFSMQSNKADRLVVPTTRWRGSDNLFHFAHEHVIDPGFQSPTNEGFVTYSLVTEHDNDPLSPNNIQPVWDAYRFNPAGAADTVFTMDSYAARRYDTAAVNAGASFVIPSVDLSSPETVALGTDIPVETIIPSRPGEFFQAPNVFLTESASPVFGFEKVDITENESFAFIQKTLVGGPTVAAGTMYIADFTLNTDIAETIKHPNVRLRMALVGLEPGSQINYVEGFAASVNSLAITDGGGNPVTALDKSPRPGSPSVVSLYMIPSPRAVGATFQVAFDYIENTAPPLTNDVAGRIWVSQISLRSVPISSLTPIE